MQQVDSEFTIVSVNTLADESDLSSGIVFIDEIPGPSGCNTSATYVINQSPGSAYTEESELPATSSSSRAEHYSSDELTTSFCEADSESLENSGSSATYSGHVTSCPYDPNNVRLRHTYQHLAKLNE